MNPQGAAVGRAELVEAVGFEEGGSGKVFGMFSTSTWTRASRLAALLSGGFALLLVGVLVGVVAGGGGKRDFVRVLTDPVTPAKAQADLKSKSPLTVTVTTTRSPVSSHTVTAAAPPTQTVTITQPASTVTVTEPTSSSDTTTTAP